MTGILVEKAGLQATLQGGPRIGLRHLGIPASGAADGLSRALANRILGNAPHCYAIETTLTGIRLAFTQDTEIAITGGACDINLNGETQQPFEPIVIQSDDKLELKPLTTGCRAYIAVKGGFKAETWLGSGSTYLPAGKGGFQGRALQDGDWLELLDPENRTNYKSPEKAPSELRPHIGHSWLLRAVRGPEFNILKADAGFEFFKRTWTVSQRCSRMGAELEGTELESGSDGLMASAATFPGTIQLPPGGLPFLLMADCGTTGGYPRIAQVIRADRHMLGQLRPGDRLQFMQVTEDAAATVLREKTELLKSWLGDAFQLR